MQDTEDACYKRSCTLVSYLRRRYGTQDEAAATNLVALSSRQRARLIEFIEQRLAGNIGLLDLAELSGYTPDHFSRLFKRCFGQSPYQYVLARRVERAKGLLRDRSESIAEIATACGFRRRRTCVPRLNSAPARPPGLTGAAERGARGTSRFRAAPSAQQTAHASRRTDAPRRVLALEFSRPANSCPLKPAEVGRG